MPENNTTTIRAFHVRAKLPQLFRYAALGLLALTVLAIVVGFYRSRSSPEFRMKGFPTSLSKDVVAVVNDYERREMEGDVQIYITADRERRSGNLWTREAYLEVFDPMPHRQDHAAKAL